MYGWLTPDSIPSGNRSVNLLIPDDEQWEAIVRGALLPLVDAANFQQFGDVTPQETADIFMLMFLNLLEQFDTYADRVKAIFGDSLLAIWPLWEPSGNTAFDFSGHGRHGTFANVALAQAGIGDGRTAAAFNGTSSHVNCFSTPLSAAFNAPEGTIMAWAKVSASGVWSDGAVRNIVKFGVDASNYVQIARSSVANRVNVVHRAGGVSVTGPISALTSTDFIHFGLTWNKATDQAKGYLQGVQSGSTLTGLGTWAGTLNSTVCCIGSFSTAPTQLWSGSIAHVALGNRALTAEEILALSTPN